MYRRIEYSVKQFKKGSILIRRPKSVDEDVAIGDWDEYYPELKLKYNTREDKNPTNVYLMRDNREIVGYFMATDFIEEKPNGSVEKFQRKMVLHDFAIFSRTYAKHGKLLLNFFYEISKKCYCKVIEIRKVEGFEYFYKFLKANFQTTENKDCYVIKIENAKAFPYEQNLKIFEGDKLSLEDLYFLFALKFKIYKNKCVYKHNDFNIIVDRKSGLVSLPKNVDCYNNNVLFDENAKKLIYLLCLNIHNNNFEEIFIKKDLKTNFLGSARYKDCLIAFNEVYTDYELLNRAYIAGFDFIEACEIKFDYHHLFFTESQMVDIKKHLASKTKHLDIEKISLKETLKQMKIAEEFNERLNSIKRFDFQMGNPFSGIKKFAIIFGDGVEIKHNGFKEDIEQEKVFEKETIISQLKRLYFKNWKQKYFNENKFKEENAWEVSLTLEDEKISFKGLDAYPNVWLFLVEFIEKYSTLTLRQKTEDF